MRRCCLSKPDQNLCRSATSVATRFIVIRTDNGITDIALAYCEECAKVLIPKHKLNKWFRAEISADEFEIFQIMES